MKKIKHSERILKATKAYEQNSIFNNLVNKIVELCNTKYFTITVIIDCCLVASRVLKKEIKHMVIHENAN